MEEMIEVVDASETFSLRHSVLGRGRVPADVAARDDSHPDAGHFAVRMGGVVVATGTVRRRQAPSGGSGPHWQIRGMAVAPALRGRVLGSAVLLSLLDHVAVRGGGLVWCHVRIAAKSLYERHGFVPQGRPLEDAVAGVQLFMSRTMAPRSTHEVVHQQSAVMSDSPSPPSERETGSRRRRMP
jgi:GNAT superfamily N-acetyltransferase